MKKQVVIKQLLCESQHRCHVGSRPALLRYPGEVRGTRSWVPQLVRGRDSSPALMTPGPALSPATGFEGGSFLPHPHCHVTDEGWGQMSPTRVLRRFTEDTWPILFSFLYTLFPHIHLFTRIRTLLSRLFLWGRTCIFFPLRDRVIQTDFQCCRFSE